MTAPIDTPRIREAPIRGASHRRPRKSRRLAAVIITAVLTLSVCTAAYAYWTALGSGAGAGSATTPQAVTLTPGLSPPAELYPGGSAEIDLTAANPNAFSVHIDSLVLNTAQGTSGFSVDGSHSGCGLGSLSMLPQNNGGAGWTIDPSASLPITLTNALSMAASAGQACQNATFTVYVVAG